MTSTAVEDCILSVDSIIRLGGAVADDDSDDESERIQTALNSAGEKYGLHFEGQEARILEAFERMRSATLLMKVLIPSSYRKLISGDPGLPPSDC